MSEKTIIPFYGGHMSQWFACEFVIDGIKYNCTEQFMMAEKARLFGDKDAEQKIMNHPHPRLQKAEGRKVRNFVKKRWEAVARDVVYRANYAKYMQNPGIQYELKQTKDAILVEASPYDDIWGIKLGQHDPKVYDQSKWRGTNWLGEVLMKVRDDIINERETKDDFGWS